jgi:two-component system, NarL family, sensor kinase
MKRLYSVPFFFLLVLTVNAQTREIDSVLQVIKTTSSDSTRAEALADVCWLLKYSDPARAISFGRQGLAIARENHFDALEAHALNSIGVTYWAKGNYDSALVHIEPVSEIYKRLGNKKGEAVSNTNLGLILQNQGNYEKALDHALKALRQLEDMGDRSGIASTLLNIGNIYFLREEFPEAKKYYFRSLALKRELDDKNVMHQNIQKTLGNIASLYQKLKKNDSAFFYLKAAIPYALRVGDLKNLCLSYTQIGRTFSTENQFDSALYYYGKSLAIYNAGKFVNDFDRAALLQSISQTYMDKGDIKTAIRYGQETLRLAESTNNTGKLKEAYELLTILYERNGNSSLALDAMKKFMVYKDSLVNTEKNKQIAEIQTKYETEKKDNQIHVLNQENELKQASLTKKNWLIATLVLAIGLVVMAFAVWRKNQQQKQMAALQEQKLKLRDAEIRAEIESQENERKRFARDLHDGMGQSISALKLFLQALPSNARLEDRISIVEKSETLLNDMHHEIRRIAFNLMPQTLVQHGLVTALSESVQRINASGKITVKINSFDMPTRLPEVQEISLYRIVQEWINNVLKYAEATVIDVQLFGYETEIVITIEDNGNGFNRAALEQSEGNGWKNIRSRLSLIKGTFELDTNEQRKGTTFILKAPVDATNNANEVLLESAESTK